MQFSLQAASLETFGYTLVSRATYIEVREEASSVLLRPLPFSVIVQTPDPYEGADVAKSCMFY
jgi:hypothetical protein